MIIITALFYISFINILADLKNSWFPFKYSLCPCNSFLKSLALLMMSSFLGVYQLT